MNKTVFTSIKKMQVKIVVLVVGKNKSIIGYPSGSDVNGFAVEVI